MSLARVLLVDDEPAVLEGIQRLMRKQYEITIASGPQAALDAIDPARPFAVVVSDMRMPVMNGAQLLARFHERTPDTVRILLTGQADLDAAISAVNDGQLFRFLTKPCPHERFAPALAAAVEQHRLITSERVLLEQTLLGTTRALTEMLSMLEPGTFGAAMRQHERVRTVAARLDVKQGWQIEIASMLSSVGFAVLPAEVVRKFHSGASLDDSEQQMVGRVPEVVDRVLGNIPRLEPVRELLRLSSSASVAGRELPVGARILRAVSALGVQEAKLGSVSAAVQTLLDRAAEFDLDVVSTIAELCGERLPEIKNLPLAEVRIGMRFASDVKTKTGTLLVAKGQSVTIQLLDRLRNFDQKVGVVVPIPCEVPADGAGF